MLGHNAGRALDLSRRNDAILGVLGYTAVPAHGRANRYVIAGYFFNARCDVLASRYVFSVVLCFVSLFVSTAFHMYAESLDDKLGAIYILVK